MKGVKQPSLLDLGEPEIDSDFSGMCVAFPCGHSGICLSCVNRGYKNKCDDGKYDRCFMRNCCTVKCVYTKVIL